MNNPSEKDKIDFYEDVYKKVRRNWGDVDPRTKILKSKKKYKRAVEKNQWKKDLDDRL